MAEGGGADAGGPGRPGPVRLKPKLRTLALAGVVLAASGGPSAAEAPLRRGAIHADVPAQPDPARSWLLYVHGRILEQQGRHAKSPDFGPYAYDAILDTFAARGFEVVSEVRSADVGDGFIARLVAQVRRLRAGGVAPEQIAVVGASRGGFLTLAAAAELDEPRITFVVLAGCGTATVARAPRLRGRILSIYDRLDRFTPSCRATFSAAPQLSASREIVLDQGRDHGLLYRPYPEWVEPTVAWISGALPQSTTSR